MKRHLFILALSLFFYNFSFSQWTNRYPKVDGFGHHVYLEGYELPILNSGPTYPAPSPTKNQVVFSAKGWLWLMDLNSLEAKRITYSPDIDSSPNWSPDGNQIVFVRDNSSDTKIVILDLASKTETTIVNAKALDLDPIYSKDGKHIYYASAENGSLDIWKVNISTKEKQVITNSKNLERLPISFNSEESLIYLKKMGFSYDSIELFDTAQNTSQPLAEENFMSQTSFSLSPDNRTLVYTWPKDDNYELRLLDIQIPKSTLLLTKSNNLPINPKFSYDGKWIYYSEFNQNERSKLKRINVNGGKSETLNPKTWDWNSPTGKLKIISRVDNVKAPVRLNVKDINGHPIIPWSGIIHSDGQNGMVFFYSPGEIEIEAPLGEITITGVQGFTTIKTEQKVNLRKDSQTTTVNLSKIWDANANGWYSGDNHFHLNYGGTNQLDPDDIVLDLKAEDLDVAFPLLANLGQRFLEQDLWDWNRKEPPFIQFGQEVRSHFLGHLGLLGTKKLYWPWVWGPYYDIYGRDDRLNAEPLRFARSQNAIGGYVHPVSVRNPFDEKGSRRIPIELIADCVLGEADVIEIGCLWSDEIGTASLWHQILNIGVPLTISAGSDVMNDLYRTMAIGASRVYVKPEGELSIDSYLEALKKGQSFVSTGPLIEFQVDGNNPGDIVKSEKRKTKWSLNIHSVVAYEKVEIFVNGKVIWSKKGSEKPGTKTYKGSIDIPSGGWVTARASGGTVEWPLMDSYPYAETSPIWFDKIGSTHPESKVLAAKELLKLLDVSEERLKKGYGSNPIPQLESHFNKAKNHLIELSKTE
ncbi:CehA/McbA family metallohydrolase [Seonamhaeicola sp. ML3]|uniref:CehA/McbA family metallohydrolase n=1 Tax=Seonamhaeicola sp. ML3 TaxID=2937786 RepID=UPI00200C6583|nr:CehA/McbA family metallohydrolase [Seonamhaeicola sp. ML3]